MAWLRVRLELSADDAVELLWELAHDVLTCRGIEPDDGDGPPAALEMLLTTVRRRDGPAPLRSVVIDGINRLGQGDETREFTIEGAVRLAVSPADVSTSTLDADARDGFAPCLVMLMDRLASMRPELADQLDGGAAGRLLPDHRRMVGSPFVMRRLPAIDAGIADIGTLLIHLTDWANFEPPVPQDPFASMVALAQCRPRYFQHGACAWRLQLGLGRAIDRDDGGVSIVLPAMLDGGRDAGDAVRFDLYPAGSRTVIEYGAVSTFEIYVDEKLAELEEAFPELRRRDSKPPRSGSSGRVDEEEWPAVPEVSPQPSVMAATVMRLIGLSPGRVAEHLATARGSVTNMLGDTLGSIDTGATAEGKTRIRKGGRRPGWPPEEIDLYVAELDAVRRRGGNYRLHCELHPDPPHESKLQRPHPKTVERWERLRRTQGTPRER